jgi:hypothetical protein
MVKFLCTLVLWVSLLSLKENRPNAVISAEWQPILDTKRILNLPLDIVHSILKRRKVLIPVDSVTYFMSQDYSQ